MTPPITALVSRFESCNWNGGELHAAIPARPFRRVGHAGAGEVRRQLYGRRRRLLATESRMIRKACAPLKYFPQGRR